jgi:D-alanyl-lipoteichoic acid acyltransferase DltB (MBOAT superfamily)
MSYTIDVYRRACAPTRSFPTFLTFVTFWPQLIAGPVLRASEVIPQLEAERRFSRADLVLGLELVVLGLFKKMVLADGLAPMVDEAFAKDPGTLNALDVWVSSFLFGFQIYFDFAGYSTVALGSALLLGLRFPANFDWPYLAGSPREFWQRWHVSLSSWIRDYLYLPLTGQRFRTESTGGIAVAAAEAGSARRNRALLLTWLIMGLWHGAAWTFVLWGLYHALLILAYRVVPLLGSLPERAPRLATVAMLFLAMAGWIFFRAQSVGQALGFFGTILDPRRYGLAGRSVDIYAYLWAGAVTAGMFALRALLLWHARRPFPRWVVLPAATASMAVLVCAILTCMRQVKQFIYFQF